jgi:hypothetical protein
MPLYSTTTAETKDVFSVSEMLDILDKLIIEKGDETSVFTKYGYNLTWVSEIKRMSLHLDQYGIMLVQTNPSITKAAWQTALFTELVTSKILSSEQLGFLSTFTPSDLNPKLEYSIQYSPTYKSDRTFAEYISDNQVEV